VNLPVGFFDGTSVGDPVGLIEVGAGEMDGTRELDGLDNGEFIDVPSTCTSAIFKLTRALFQTRTDLPTAPSNSKV
jgi:hypothetical protein